MSGPPNMAIACYCGKVWAHRWHITYFLWKEFDFGLSIFIENETFTKIKKFPGKKF